MKDAQIKRRDALQIAYHWVNFASIASLTLTGLAIYFGYTGTALYFTWHLWAAWVLLGALVVHVWYDTVTRNNFDRMWATSQDLRDAMKRLPAQGARAGQTPKHGHYKVEQIAFHWIIAAVVFGLVITGLILWKPGRMFAAPFWMPWGWDGVFIARIVHQALTFVVVVLVLAHVYFAVCVPKNWYLLKSIFSGRVRLPAYSEHHRISSRLESHLEPRKRSKDRGAPAGEMGGVQKG